MKTALSTLMLMVSMHASAQLCQLALMDKQFELPHLYVFEQNSRLNGGQPEWVVFCLAAPVVDSKLDVKALTFDMQVKDIFGVSITMTNQGKQIKTVMLSWHDDVFAMISGVLADTEFNGDITKKHIKGVVQSSAKLNAQKSTLVNGEWLNDEVDWGFVVTFDQAIIQSKVDQ